MWRSLGGVTGRMAPGGAGTGWGGGSDQAERRLQDGEGRTRGDFCRHHSGARSIFPRDGSRKGRWRPGGNGVPVF